jgi:hypothetical protein
MANITGKMDKSIKENGLTANDTATDSGNQIPEIVILVSGLMEKLKATGFTQHQQTKNMRDILKIFLNREKANNIYPMVISMKGSIKEVNLQEKVYILGKMEQYMKASFYKDTGMEKVS